jgi:hypothetical protein
MATRLQKIQQFEDEEAAQQYLPAEIPEEIEETATDRVASMLAGINGLERSELKVYKLNQGSLEYCQGFKPEQFEEGNFDLLRDRFGHGEFELRLYATHPQTRKFGIRSKLRVKMSEVNKAAMTDSLPSGLTQVLGTIANGQAQMLDALVQMKQQPQKDPMEEMTKMLSMMTMMRQAMGIDGQQRSGSSIGEIVEAIRELRSAADEVSPQREEPENMMSMLPKVLDIVSAGMSKGQAQAQAQAQAHPEPEAFHQIELPPAFAQQVQQPQAQPQSEPQPAYQPNPEPVQTQPQTEEQMQFGKYLFKLRAYLSALVDMATRAIPPEKTAEFVVDKLPDELLEIMELPNWFEQLAAVAPEVKNHEAYLRQVRDLALGMLEFEDEGEDDIKTITPD